MSSVVIKGDTSGQVTLTVPAVAGTNTATLPAGTGTIAVQGASTNIVSGTAVASTSGTSIDFTSIPSWVKKITVMFQGVSTNGTSLVQIQLGSSSFTTTGYLSTASTNGGNNTSTTGLLAGGNNGAADTRYGAIIITNITGNTWIQNGNVGNGTANSYSSSGGVTIGGVLDRVRITTVNGTDTFDAGTINILYE